MTTITEALCGGLGAPAGTGVAGRATTGETEALGPPARAFGTAEIGRLRELLEGRHGLRLAIVFGSLARGGARPDSDLDIAVQSDRPLSAAQAAALIERLAGACGRPVDLIDLMTVGEPLLGQILAHGQRLFGHDADHAALIRRHVFDAEDFLPYARRMLRERRRAWIG